MGHTHTSLIYHVVFSTKNRVAMITPDLSGRLFPYIFGILRQFGVPIIVTELPTTFTCWFRYGLRFQ